MRVYFNMPAMPSDDAEANGQSKPQTCCSLGSEEWIENLRLNLGVHAHAGVRYGDYNRVVDSLCGKGECSPFRHGIDCIEDYVDENFTEFGVVAHHHGIRTNLQVEGNVNACGLCAVLPTW